MDRLPVTSAREAAYLSLLAAMREEAFIAENLERWQALNSPPSQDFQFARELAAGSCRRLLTLEYLAQTHAPTKKLNLKRKEKALLYTALYQHFFMGLPLYAIANESVAIAKKHCSLPFAQFLNRFLRQLTTISLALPQEKTPEALSISTSYPQSYIKKLLAAYPLQTVEEILAATNHPSPAMARERTPPFALHLLDSKEKIDAIASSPDFYIQNSTPVTLMKELASRRTLPPPATILDLCSSPGGKLLLAHDLYPAAALYANDVSDAKLQRLKENLAKYTLDATLSQTPGELYRSPTPFDLIIVDAPCSNSGVYNKRPEARWRQNTNLPQLQHALLANAASLLSPTGEIWYLTCSILAEENASLIAAAAKNLNLTVSFSLTILPDLAGNDGGFACLLRGTPLKGLAP